MAEPVSQSCISVLNWQMSLAPGGFGYDAACIMFVKGFCREGVGQKAENLKQPLLAVCKAVLYDATSPGKPFGLLSSLPLLSTALLLRFSPCRVGSSCANLGGFPPALLTSLKLDVQKSLCVSPCVAEGLWQKPESVLSFFSYERGFSQLNSLVHLSLLEDHVASPLIEDKTSN